MDAGEVAWIPAGEQRVSVNDKVEHLLDQYEQPLFAYLLALVGNRELAQDCTQDTFLRALEHMGRGKDVNARWLYTVGRNRAIDHLGDRRRVGPGDGAFETI